MNKSIVATLLLSATAIGIGLFNLSRNQHNGEYVATVEECSSPSGQSLRVTRLVFPGGQPRHGTENVQARVTTQGLRNDSINYVNTRAQIGIFGSDVREDLKEPQAVVAGNTETADYTLNFRSASIAGKLVLTNRYMNNSTGERACSRWTIQLT